MGDDFVMGLFDSVFHPATTFPDYSRYNRDNDRTAERLIGKICPPAGKALEKVNNVMDSVENVRKATSPFDRISDEITSCNCDEARRKLKKGDHIYVNRSVYSHHGIYDGSGGVYEYQDGSITYSDIETFAQGDGILVKSELAAYSPDEIVRRAQTRFGEAEYNLFHNNCENFATWCRCGMEEN